MSRKYQDLENVLMGLELQKLSAVFEDHDVGVAEFLCLSDSDLVEMGIREVKRNRCSLTMDRAC